MCVVHRGLDWKAGGAELLEHGFDGHLLVTRCNARRPGWWPVQGRDVPCAALGTVMGLRRQPAEVRACASCGGSAGGGDPAFTRSGVELRDN